MKGILEQVLNLLYPESSRCLLCGGIHKQAGMCYNCKQSFSAFRPPAVIPLVDEIMALAHYEKQIRTTIHRLKFFNSPAIARQLALVAARVWEKEICQYEVVTAVPMHRRRYIQRGYNQAELLAREVASATGLPYHTCLCRVQPTDPQHNLSRIRRRQNVRDVFRPVLPFEYGHRVLLVDDILTTGSTVASCARVLKDNGISQVGVLVVAWSGL